MTFSFFSNKPRALKIVEIDENRKLVLNEENLKTILYHPKSRNKHVCLISIAGAFRKGKSFMLNFFIRFFRNGGRDKWIENEADLMNSFHWRCGSDRDTTGVFMWSEPFLLRTLKNEEVAVLFMDTQGSFDTTSTTKECATLFALSLMVSSIQIYNLSQNIQEDDLQNLQLFADYGRLVIDSTHNTPFQTLVFLVRDWFYSYEYPYGFYGGQQFLSKRMGISCKPESEILETRNFIRNCFKQIKCFLMPHPGLKAASNPYFEGRINEIDPCFKNNVVNLVEGLFHEKMFQIKEINGLKVTSIEIFEYFKTYCNAFDSNNLPNPKSLLKATAEANNLAAKAIAKEFYTNLMDSKLGAYCPLRSLDEIKKIHEEVKLAALEKFDTIKKMGGNQTSKLFMIELNNELDRMVATYYKANSNKKPNSSTKTPYTLFLLMTVNYMIANILSFLWLGFFSFLFMLGFYISLLALIFWLFCKYRGEYKEITNYIDGFSSFIWKYIIKLFVNNLFSNCFNFKFLTSYPIETIIYSKPSFTKSIRQEAPNCRGDSKD